MRHALWVLVCLALPVCASAADASFNRAGVVRLLGYDPEHSPDQCERRSTTARIVRLALTTEAAAEKKVAIHLNVAGVVAMAAASCAADNAPDALAPFVKTGDILAPPVCLAAAAAAQGKITENISAMMSAEPPELVAGYAEGVAGALEPIGEACRGDNTIWSKVAAQALLIKNRAVNIRASKSCIHWRMAIDKELKAAKEAGETKGKTAGLKHLDERAGAALLGAQHYCGEDSTASLIKANFGLTKMLINSMPEE